MVFRRAFLAGSTAWIVAIPLAAFAATRPAAGSLTYGFAIAVYAIGRFACHQLAARSFHLWGASLPVCARCTGVYAGAALTALTLALSGRRFETNRARLVFTIALLPTAATLIFEWTTGVTPSNSIRAISGVPLGAAVAWAIGMVN